MDSFVLFIFLVIVPELSVMLNLNDISVVNIGYRLQYSSMHKRVLNAVKLFL
jgi:hypothetical protein